MEALITGSSSGIGLATAQLFLERGWNVTGVDIAPAAITDTSYRHYVADVASKEALSALGLCPDVVVTCAGVQNSGRDIEVNLLGTINTVEAFAFHKGIRSVLMVASSSAHTGAEFIEYAAAKGGVLTYMRGAAQRLAQLGATCNSISPGGVTTEMNRPVMDDPKLWQQIMDQTPLHHWAEPREIAEWIWFLTVVNHSCTGQDILIDAGEKDLNFNFVWPAG